MRIEKKQLVNEIGSIIEKSSFLYLINYKGLKVKEITELRIALEKQKTKCQVLKNTLILKAAAARGADKLASLKLAGDTAFVYGSGDPGAVAKTLSEFIKKHSAAGFKCGYLDKGILSASDIETISKLPSREILLAQLLGLLQSPARNLVSLLNAKLSGIVYVLNAVKEKKNN